MNIEDLVKKYGLIKFGDYYRWEVSGIEILGFVIKKIGNRFMMAGEINTVVILLGSTPHIEHNLWVDVEFWEIEDRLKELNKQWNKAVMKIKEYRMKEKMERIDRDF